MLLFMEYIHQVNSARIFVSMNESQSSRQPLGGSQADWELSE